jgi:hypothetical protein
MKIKFLTLMVAAIPLLMTNTVAQGADNKDEVNASASTKADNGGAGKANMQDISIIKPQDKKKISTKAGSGGAGKANFQEINMDK